MKERRPPPASHIAATIAPQAHPKLTITTVREERARTGYLDGFRNIANNIGVIGKDSAAGTVWVTPPPLNYAALEGMFRHDGIGRRIVEIPVREMMRRGFEVEGDEDGLVLKYLHKRGIMESMRFLLRWSRLYGGAIGVLICDDGQEDWSKPLREDSLKSITGMNVFDRWRCTFTTADMQTDPKKPGYMWPTRYYVMPIGIGTPFWVHASRVIRMDGAALPELDRQANNYWMDSVIQTPYKAFMALMSVYGIAQNILTDLVQGVFAMQDLSSLVAAGNEDTVIRRLQIMRMFKSVVNVMPIDKDGETYTKVTGSIAGLPDTMDQFWAWLSGVTGWPQTIWQGRSPTGLNASGDAEMEMFYNAMHEAQVEILGPAWERIVSLVYKCKDGPTAGKLPADFKINFLPLSQPTEKDQADIDYKNAQTDQIRVTTGSITVEEARTRLDHGSNSVKLQKGWKPPKPVEAPPPGAEDGAPGKPAKKKPEAAA